MSTDPHRTSDVSITTDLSSNIDDSPEGEDEGGEEEGECGFCLFMKGGGCKDTFVAWEECIAAAENGKEDVAEKCFQVTSLLRKCMEANAEYYEPVLRAEKHADEAATVEVEKELGHIEGKVEKAGGLDSDRGASGKPDAA